MSNLTHLSILLAVMIVNPGACLRCKDIQSLDNVPKQHFYKWLKQEGYSMTHLRRTDQIESEWKIVTPTSLLSVHFAKEGAQPLSVCEKLVDQMFLKRTTYVNFNRLQKISTKFDFVPRALRCFYTMNHPEGCGDDYKIMSVVETERSIPLSQLISSLDSTPLRYYFRSFRMRIRMYKAIWERVQQMQQLGLTHCRLSLDSIALVIPPDFTDLLNDGTLQLKLRHDPLSEIDFFKRIKVKFLNPDFIVIKEQCPNHSPMDPYFQYMTTNFEGAQRRHSSFGSWELAMAFLDFETQFHILAAGNYSETDPGLFQKFKAISDNFKNAHIKNLQKYSTHTHILEFLRTKLLQNIRQIRKHSVYKTSNLEDLLGEILLKNYQMNQVMAGRVVDDDFSMEKKEQFPYMKFMRFLGMNLKVNINKRVSFRNNAKLLASISFPHDSKKAKKKTKQSDADFGFI